ncbi:hypothetical protein AUJ14_01380 [Candidatus Micrarchaeota archaeon CG1_02_55_22]|nr:MAG: hypothetical protein AUJ14_01380 [Candidatus Micrarchaeota archaeon CG1_02_55_22]
MGNVLVSLDEAHDKLLRRLAARRGGKKGDLSNVVAEGLDELARSDAKEASREQLFALMRKGFDLGLKGKKVYESRDEIYD